MKKEEKQLLQALCEAAGVSGDEKNVAAVAEQYLKGFAKSIQLTPLGSLTAEICEGKPHAPHLVLTAHMDQIGFIVTHLAEKGFLYAAAVGGYDGRILAGQRVTVHTAQGDENAVIASTPPHLQQDKETPPETGHVLLDTGYTEAEAKKHFAPGDTVTLNGVYAELLGGRVSAPALDDRSGCAAVLMAAKKLAGNPVECRVSVLLASQEETHGAGALSAMGALHPDLALAVDVSFAKACGAPAHHCGTLSKGPMIGFAPILSKKVSKRLTALAQQLKLPYQVEVMGGTTGTDADQIAASGAGVVTGLVSIPQKYMHTPVEIVDWADIEATAVLLEAFAKEAQDYAAQ